MRIIILLITIFLFTVKSFTRDLHVYLVGGTIRDRMNIVKGEFEADMFAKSISAMQNFVDEVDNYTKLNVIRYDFTGDNFNKELLLKHLKKTDFTDDIVLFYSISHGQNMSGCLYPYLDLGYTRDKENELIGGDVGISSCEINEIIKSKKPRLQIMLYDACNNVATNTLSSASINKKYKKYYSHLFEKATGYVIMSGTKKGDVGIVDPKRGGWFTNYFLRSIYESFDGDNWKKPDGWAEICKKALDDLATATFGHSELKKVSQTNQTGYYEEDVIYK
jgi:hypothetical protein